MSARTSLIHDIIKLIVTSTVTAIGRALSQIASGK